MFLHTLGFKKQGCSSIIEDYFVSQQHLMEEAPMDYDLDWTIDNFESLAATTPGFAAQALNSLTRHTRSARWDPKPAAKFVAALPGIDQEAFTIFQKGNKHRLRA
jgi:hypothetical protein